MNINSCLDNHVKSGKNKKINTLVNLNKYESQINPLLVPGFGMNTSGSRQRSSWLLEKLV
jgi:hypothetical protein